MLRRRHTWRIKKPSLIHMFPLSTVLQLLFLTHIHSFRPYPLPMPLLLKVQLREEPVHLFVHICFVFAVAPTERCHCSIARNKSLILLHVVGADTLRKRQRFVLPTTQAFSDIPGPCLYSPLLLRHSFVPSSLRILRARWS